jgi:HB1, ASXL, restriction endonuclease HTH domain
MAARTARKKATRKQAAKKQAPAKKATKKKLSQMAAAGKVLATAKKPMNCREMVEAMARNRLWSSPSGKTPDATLYAAVRYTSYPTFTPSATAFSCE